ncbi:MAG TPA: nicotinate-nucleotide adenylyltransferase [Kiritimatiellia bacterium]|nr:nicotinate-nucleotide adenylyltransferase [Kiritimatiellia bacterium]
MNKLKIGIFGGSFNPIHLGHLIMAQDAGEAYSLDRIIFVPAAIAPHKLTQTLVTPSHRLDMIRLALGDRSEWEVSDEEIRRGGVSYTIDTVQHFIAVYPEADIYFIIGGDTLPELHTWKDINDLLALCKFITMVRPGFDPESLHRQSLRLPPGHVEALISRVTVGHVIDLSSTEIRVRVAKNESIRYLVPDSVERYIREHQLYRK